MSDDDSSVSSGDDNQSMKFNPWLVGGGKPMTYLKDLQNLKHVTGEELHRVLPEQFNVLVFEGQASRESKEYERVLFLLQSSRRWRTIGLADYGQTRATPEFLSLVVLALTKTNFVTLNNCPLDENFFACLNSGMQTLKRVNMLSGTIRISYKAAAIFANGLALSGCLEGLEINRKCWFEPGAGLKLVEGINRNNSLKALTISESNLSTVAMISILRAVTEGCLPKLTTLHITLESESDCTNYLTKLISSDTNGVKNLKIDRIFNHSTIFRTDDVWMGKGNHKLKSLFLTRILLDESYLTMMMPMMPALSRLELCFCEISDITPIVDHLCRPNAAIKSIDLRGNRIGIDQAEKFVASLADMQSLKSVNLSINPWKNDVDKERVGNILQKASNCCNLEWFHTSMSEAQQPDLKLNLAINRAWRRELCYKNSSPPSKLFPLVIARALRKTNPEDLRAEVVFALLRERTSDLMPVRIE